MVKLKIRRTKHECIRTRAIPPAIGFVQRSRKQRAQGACRRHPGRAVPSLGAHLPRRRSRDCAYVVVRGSVQVFATDRNGDEVVLAQLKELSHVGEQSLLPGSAETTVQMQQFQLGSHDKDAILGGFAPFDWLAFTTDKKTIPHWPKIPPCFKNCQNSPKFLSDFLFGGS